MATTNQTLKTLQELVDRVADYGERTAILKFHQDDTESWTYGELASLSRRLAAGLRQKGVARGAYAGLIAERSPDLVVATLAVLTTGATTVPIDAQFPDDTLRRVLDDSGVQLVFTNVANVETLAELDTERDIDIVVLDDDADDRHWRNLLRDANTDNGHVSEDDTATLFYTSGTTGPPKGVPLSHRNLSFQMNTLHEAGLVTEEDRALLPLPLHHVYPFVIGMLAPLSLGLPIIMPHALTGPQLVRAMTEGEVTIVVGVPRLYEALYSGIEAQLDAKGKLAASAFTGLMAGAGFVRDWTSVNPAKGILAPLRRRIAPDVRVLVSGGAALPAELAGKLLTLGWQLGEGYGLTETSPMLTINAPDEYKIGSAGRPVEGIEIRLDPAAVPEEKGGTKAESDGKHRQTGEIMAKGPGVFAGYHHLPGETEKVLSEDGWFRTGDLGAYDDDGYLYVLGRVSTLIVTEGGENVQPETVEEAYAKAAIIQEAGVLQRDGKLVGVIVPDTKELARKKDKTAEELIREAVQQTGRGLPSYQRLSDYVVSREALARTRLGKIRRHLLKERYEEAKSGGGRTESAKGKPIRTEDMSDTDQGLLEERPVRETWELLTEKYPDVRLTPDSHLQLDLGIDSLEWVDLTLELQQRARIELDERATQEVETVRDLLETVAEAATRGSAIPEGFSLQEPDELLTDEQKKWLQSHGSGRKTAAGILFGLNRAIMAPFRVHAEGLENLPDEGPYLITPNHTSYLDPFVLAAVLPFQTLLRTHWGGWTGVAFVNPFTRLVSRLAQVVPVEPERAALSSLAYAAAVVRQKDRLIWFPEGQRSPTGQLQPLKPGIGLLLNEYDVPLVPTYIKGAYEALPRQRRFPRVRSITVYFGKPVSRDELSKLGSGRDWEACAVDGLREKLSSLIEAHSRD